MSGKATAPGLRLLCLASVATTMGPGRQVLCGSPALRRDAAGLPQGRPVGRDAALQVRRGAARLARITAAVASRR